MSNWLKNPKITGYIEWGSFCIFLVVSFIFTLNHEMWRDEAQSYLIVKNNDFKGIFEQLKYEGHFLLWYIIIIPFIRLGVEYIKLKYISYFFVAIGMFIFVQKSPFKWYTKILIMFLLPNVTLYSSFFRCYCLILIGISLLAIVYPKRHKNPIIYMLAICFVMNIHVLFEGMVCALVIDYLCEIFKNRKNIEKEQINKYEISLEIAFFITLIRIYKVVCSMFNNKYIY